MPKNVLKKLVTYYIRGGGCDYTRVFKKWRRMAFGVRRNVRGVIGVWRGEKVGNDVKCGIPTYNVYVYKRVCVYGPRLMNASRSPGPGSWVNHDVIPSPVTMDTAVNDVIAVSAWPSFVCRADARLTRNRHRIASPGTPLRDDKEHGRTVAWQRRGQRVDNPVTVGTVWTAAQWRRRRPVRRLRWL